MATALLLGKYEIVQRLAVGGMAEVFLARMAGPAGFEKQLVVKRILPHLTDEPSFVAMFLSEARLAGRLNHPNVVQVFDFGEVNGSYYLVMEYIDGVSLRRLVRRADQDPRPPPYPLIARIISLACEGLAYAHEFVDPATGAPLDLVHRDVSPENILIARTGSVKVVDFGVAKATGQTNLTRTGAVKGKFGYMPPEQLRGEVLDRRADVFALGMVLFELIAGRKPFEMGNDAAIVRIILYEPLASAADFRPDVPPALLRIVDKALAKRREDRYSDCRQLQADLERFIHESPQPVSQLDLAQLVQQVMSSPQTEPSPPTPRAGMHDLPEHSTIDAPRPEVAHVLTAVIKGVPLAAPLSFPFPPAPPWSAPAPAPGDQPQHLPPADELDPTRPARPAFSASAPARPSWPSARPVRTRTTLIAYFVGAVLVGVIGAALLGRLVARRPLSVPPPQPTLATASKTDQPRPPPAVPDAGALAGKVPVAAEAPAPAAVDAGSLVESPLVAQPRPPLERPKAAKKAKAAVEFRIRPFGTVWVDGVLLGVTPFDDPPKLTVGTHVVRVANRELGKETKVSFEVKPGETNVFRHSFE
jgi:serine/threonine-protein kinase